MAWINQSRCKNGTITYWIRDVRDGRQIVIDTRAGSRKEAEMQLEQYEIRKDLEKDGYDDRYSIVDEIIQNNVQQLADGRRHGKS